MSESPNACLRPGGTNPVTLYGSRLDWSIILAGVRRYADAFAPDTFVAWIHHLFGPEIPVDAIDRLRDDLAADSVPPPGLLAVEQGSLGSGRFGGYDARAERVLIDRGLLERSLNSNRDSFLLYAVLLEEFGHHLDHLLRNHYSDIGGDARLDEGALFALHLLEVDEEGFELGAFAVYNRGLARSSDGELEGERLRILRTHFSRDRLREDARGWVELATGERIFLEFFESGRGEGRHGYGHESIEDALGRAGFDAEQRKRIYLGNWMRDFSQIRDPKAIDILADALAILDRDPNASKSRRERSAREFLTAIVDVLAADHFRDTQNFRVAFDQLGDYVPAEHVDNPRPADWSTMTPAQRSQAERELGLEIDNTHWRKQYIDRSITYVQEQFSAAAEAGAGPEGYRLFGNGLHTLEDVYAHSNFIEIASTMLGHRVDTRTAELAIEGTSVTPLVTGTFGSFDTAMSVVAEIAKALPSNTRTVFGQRSSANRILLILLKRRGGVYERAGRIYERYYLNVAEGLDSLAGPVVEWVKQSIVSVSNFFRTQLVRSLIIHLLRDLKRALLLKLQQRYGREMHPDSTGSDEEGRRTELENLWADIDLIADAYLSIGNLAPGDRELIDRLNRRAFPELRRPHHATDQQLLLDQVYELGKLYQDLLTDDSSTDPTHTQLAKDHATHYLHEPAAKLAMYVVEQVGRRMHAVWFGPAGERTQNREALLRSASDYCRHPAKSGDWWRSIVRTWWHDHPNARPTTGGQDDHSHSHL